MNLSPLQEKIINAPYSKLVVTAAAAAGKTTLMTEKVRQILRAGYDPREIAVITFTNMAAGTLRQRLGADYKDGLFVGTIHALANYMLCRGGVDTSKVLNQEKFDELFEMVKDNPRCVRHMEWVLLDEAQDSDPLQFSFLFDMIKPDNFLIVGDPRQSIYGFKGSDPSLMMNLASKEGVYRLSLNENYRNGSMILSYARRIIYPTGLDDDSISMRGVPGKVTEIPYSLIDIPKKISIIDEFGDWAVLCRANLEVENVCRILKTAKIPYDTFKQGDLTNDQLDKKMLANTVKVLTIHSAKGLEWRNVIVIGTKYWPIDERNVCYVAATRARDNLFWMISKKKSFTNGMRRW